MTGWAIVVVGVLWHQPGGIMNHDTNNATTTHALGLSGTMHIRSVVAKALQAIGWRRTMHGRAKVARRNRAFAVSCESISSRESGVVVD